MINNESFTKKWIQSKHLEVSHTDPGLIEKIIYALSLLEQLKLSGMDFIFKGGTSLILLMPQPRRLSIDIDIILNKEDKNLEVFFENVVNMGVFISFEKMKRESQQQVPKAHYCFYFNSVINFDKPQKILLDILFEENCYIETKEIPIKSPLLKTDGIEVNVTVPTIDCILGDKLTAFAPNTIGVPYEKKGIGRELEVAKQLYDVSNLFDVFSDLKIVKDTYNKIALKEFDYRNMKQSTLFSLDDTFKASLSIVSKGTIEKEDYQKLVRGIKKLGAYIFISPFNPEVAIINASKVAYLAMAVKNDCEQILKFVNPNDIKDLYITNKDYLKLNRLKKTNPEAFFYIYHAINLVDSTIKKEDII